MSRSITDQLLDKGLVKPESTPAAKRESSRAARPPEPDKELPPPFEAPARGKILGAPPKKRGPA